jgi:hypothetical protein
VTQTNEVAASSLLLKTYSEVLAKLEKDRNELTVTISTLERMSISISQQLLDNSEKLSGILTILGEVEKSTVEIQRISLGVERVEQRLKGMSDLE